MNHEELTKKIDAYLDDNWDVMVEDIATLVRIPSFLESDKAADGAPFGPGPKQALDAALGIAERMGFQTVSYTHLEAGVNVVGIGYTIYLGSEYESTMMAEAGELIAQAHANGLIVVLWIYPRGKAVKAENCLLYTSCTRPVPARKRGPW